MQQAYNFPDDFDGIITTVSGLSNRDLETSSKRGSSSLHPQAAVRPNFRRFLRDGGKLIVYQTADDGPQDEAEQLYRLAVQNTGARWRASNSSRFVVGYGSCADAAFERTADATSLVSALVQWIDSDD